MHLQWSRWIHTCGNDHLPIFWPGFARVISGFLYCKAIRTDNKTVWSRYVTVSSSHITQRWISVPGCPFMSSKNLLESVHSWLSQYRDGLTRYAYFYHKDMTVGRPSYLYHGNSYARKTASLCWDGPLHAFKFSKCTLTRRILHKNDTIFTLLLCEMIRSYKSIGPVVLLLKFRVTG